MDSGPVVSGMSPLDCLETIGQETIFRLQKTENFKKKKNKLKIIPD